MKDQNCFYIILVAVVLSTLSLGIGYAQISGIEMSISGTATATPASQQNGLYISNATITSNVDADMNNTNIVSYNQSVLNTNVALSTSNSSSNVIMTVTIFNNSGATKYFDGIEYDPVFYSNSNIVAEVGNGLQPDQSLANGASVTFTVVYKYSDDYIAGATAPYDNQLSSYINFKFKDSISVVSYTVTYVNFTNPTYPTSVDAGDDLIINFDAPVPTSVLVTGSSSYTYTNGVLTILDVSSDLVIENISEVDFPVVEIVGSTVEMHTSEVNSSSPINVSDFLALVFDGKNYTNVVINRIDVVFTYTTTTGSQQSINCILNVGGTESSQVVSLGKKQTNATVTASFTGLNIGQNDEFSIRHTAANLTNSNVTFSDMKLVIYFQQ